MTGGAVRIWQALLNLVLGPEPKVRTRVQLTMIAVYGYSVSALLLVYAMRIGLVADVVEPSQLMDRAFACAHQILGNSPYATRHTKRLMWANLDASSLRAAMELENRTQVLGTFTGNMTEAGAGEQFTVGALWGKTADRWNVMVSGSYFEQKALKYGDRFHLATGFDHQIATAPVGIGNRFMLAHLNAFAVYQQGVAVGSGIVLPDTVYRVKIQQMREGSCIGGGVVDLHKLKFRPAPGSAQRQTTDTTKTVDTYLDSHKPIPSTK